MRHIAVLLTLFHLNAFANILVTTAETGFQVINPGASSGAGTPLSRSINEDPSYPYWDSYCHSYAPLPSICYPLESEYRVTHRLIQGGTLNSVDVSFTSGDIYGSATVLENNSRLDLHSGWTHDVSRNYRINLPGLSRQPNYTTSGNCSNAISFVSPIGVERGLTMTVPLKSRNSTCTINFTDIDSDTDIHIAPGGTGWRYDNSIYNRLPSGNYTLSRIINDSIEVKEYRKGVAPNVTKVLSGIDYRLKLKLLGSISFVINGDKDRRITLNPAQPESNQLRFDFRITSNFNQLNISFSCSSIDKGDCSINNGEEHVRFNMDLFWKHNDTVLNVTPNEKIKLDAARGYRLHKDNYGAINMRFNNNDIKDAQNSNELNNYIATVNVMLEPSI